MNGGAADGGEGGGGSLSRRKTTQLRGGGGRTPWGRRYCTHIHVYLVKSNPLWSELNTGRFSRSRAGRLDKTFSFFFICLSSTTGAAVGEDAFVSSAHTWNKDAVRHLLASGGGLKCFLHTFSKWFWIMRLSLDGRLHCDL